MDYVRKIDPKAFVTVYSVSYMRYQPKKTHISGISCKALIVITRGHIPSPFQKGIPDRILIRDILFLCLRGIEIAVCTERWVTELEQF